MKLNRIIKLCALAAALGVSAATVSAQQDNGGGPGGGFGGPGGGFGGGRGNFDPAQMQQRMMDNIREQLNFTNDTDWSAVQPLVQSVMDARRDAQSNGMRGMFGGRNRGGQGGGQGGPGGRGGMFAAPTPSPEQTALENALEQDAPAAQVKELLAKYRASQAAKQAKLEAAQEELKKVLTTKQEAQACLMGLVK